ncbi:MAG: VWA domain-containing protein [Rhodocyclaceae bacterium]|nr:VWA domain-containing protein [Rhodocyclaceae bacterium]
MRFLWPETLMLSLLVPLLVAAYLRALRRRQRAVIHYASLKPVRAAMGPRAALRRHVPPALFLLAVIAALFAIARPVTVLPLPAQYVTIVMAMDVSRSMLAQDVAPNRIGAAQAAARAFIETLPSNVRLGITSFAGTAAVVQTPTENREDLLAAIDRFQLQFGTATGSGLLVSLAMLRPDAGIDLEAELFGQDFSRRSRAADAANDRARAPLDMRAHAEPRPVPPGSWSGGAIVLLSDGRRTMGPDPIAAARRAAQLGVRVYTIGFGTKAGAEIPGFEGYSFWARLDEDTLRSVAQLTDAEYFHAGTAAELDKVYRKLSAHLAMEYRETEISALFSALAALLVLAAAALSMFWFRR